MLDKIPAEILTHIAYHSSVSTLSPPVELLQTCQTIHDAISPSTNPRLYARLFRSAFDINAAERRIGSEELHAKHISQELARRVFVLRRLRRMVMTVNLKDVEVDDLWVIYIMLIENDGKNIQHFLSPDGFVSLHRFLELYSEEHLLSAAVEAGYPKETTERALIMWIAWLLSGYESARKQHPETFVQKEERLFILRPYVFAPQHYELGFAPWTISTLPISEISLSNAEPHPFVADLTPKSRGMTVKHFGRDVTLTGPMLSHAAILRFFVKRPGVGGPSSGNVLLPIQALLARNNVQPRTSGRRSSPPESDDDENEDDSGEEDGDETFGAIRDLISKSKNHDRDFERLKSCYDPYSSKGMKRSAWRGSWDGCWEGTFSFFEFEAFRAMLAGHSRALYEGSFGEQAQVWRLKETWVWTQSYGQKKQRQRQREREERLKKRKEREERGEVISEEEEEELHPGDKGKGKARGLPLKGPATNAGFPTDSPQSASAGIATAAAEAITLQETINQQLSAIEGYEIVPDHEMEEVLASDDGGEEAGLEMILTGVGHSAWGRFLLKGKVRVWDGMATLVKEYAVSAESRGRWIYRGYVVSGDIFVGRWRDTFTPEEYVGYEGTFILHRR